MDTLDGRVAIITGAGRGLGREHALLFASEGAKIVVNDLGGDQAGGGADATPAQQTVEDIRAMGGEAVVNGENVADWEGARRLVEQAIDPGARTRLTLSTPGLGEAIAEPEDGSFDEWSPANVSPFVAYLSTADCTITGETFVVRGGSVQRVQTWTRAEEIEKEGRWTIE